VIVDWARLWLTIGLAVLCVVVAALCWIGWRHRAARQAAFPPLPAVPDELDPPLRTAAGVYVSTVTADSWQNRIVVQGAGRPSRAVVSLHRDGVLVDRVAEGAIWIPRSVLTGVRQAPGVAGKVMGLPNGILLLSWYWGDSLVETGLRCDDDDMQAAFLDAAAALLSAQPGALS
jgi:hypothetical protein